MKGAREYEGLFGYKGEQVGQLLIWSGKHARGHTLDVWVMPEGESIERFSSGSPNIKGDYVKVYGAVSGQPGWTETYGWLHKGPWVDDFNAIVAERRALQEQQKAEREDAKAQKEVEAHDQMMSVLNSYKPGRSI